MKESEWTHLLDTITHEDWRVFQEQGCVGQAFPVPHSVVQQDLLSCPLLQLSALQQDTCLWEELLGPSTVALKQWPCAFFDSPVGDF